MTPDLALSIVKNGQKAIKRRKFYFEATQVSSNKKKL